MDNVLFRWSVGSGYDSLFHTNLAIASLQRFCPKSSFCLSYNGKDFSKFKKDFISLDNLIDFDNLIIVEQTAKDWPFDFDIIGGAWWKWAPIDMGIKPIEVFVDTDILFINPPNAMREWVNSKSSFYASYDGAAYDMSLGLGDFKRTIKSKTGIINVGVVGLKGNIWRKLFLRCAAMNINKIKSHRSYHINEQGAANFALDLASKVEGFEITRVPFETHTWWCPNDFTITEGTHFVATTKGDLSRFYSFFREAILRGSYEASKEGYDYIQQCVFQNQTPNREEYGRICCQLPPAKHLPERDLRTELKISA
jgi:hypothetical protein